MKNKFNLFGFISLAVIISLLTIGCPEEEKEKPTISSVTISPATAYLINGKTQTFTAKVDGHDSLAKTVTWSIVETGKNSGTTINSSGLLTVAATETLTSFTVKATSTADTAKSSTATVNIMPTTALNPSDSSVQTYTNNGSVSLPSSPYHYEMWTAGGSGNKLLWYGPNQGGGAAFRAEWNNPNDFLGRIGYYWGSGKPYTNYKNMYADFAYTRSGTNTAGNYSYIGIYGWGRNPSASKNEEKLIEYYIVEDWFGNQWQGDSSPMGTSTTGGSLVGSYILDDAKYNVVKNVRQNQSSIDGTKTFTQFFSIRQTLRKSGTISITEHFKKWEALNMNLGNMYECKFLVEAGGGTGWLELSYLKFLQEDSPR